MDQSKLPQDTIVELLDELKNPGYMPTVNRINSICNEMALKNTPVVIRNMIYNAYARHHAKTDTFDDKLIVYQNGVLALAVHLPFCLEFANEKTLGKMLLRFVQSDFENHQSVAQLGINCTLMCLEEHGFSRGYVQQAIQMEVYTPGKVHNFNEALLLYLRTSILP
jgi:hypothetical protein